jgi:hypothetical protein
MKEKMMKEHSSERGSAGVKMVAVLAVLFLVGHAGINYVPVAYSGASFKEEMQTAVVQGSALPTGGDPIGVTKIKIKRSADANGVPQDAVIEVKQLNGGLSARAIYSKKVNILPFGLFTYNYQFDNTATPIGFLSKQ